MNQIINMIMRILMRKTINGGINAGIKAVSGKGKRRAQPIERDNARPQQVPYNATYDDDDPIDGAPAAQGNSTPDGPKRTAEQRRARRAIREERRAKRNAKKNSQE